MARKSPGRGAGAIRCGAGIGLRLQSFHQLTGIVATLTDSAIRVRGEQLGVVGWDAAKLGRPFCC